MFRSPRYHLSVYGSGIWMNSSRSPGVPGEGPQFPRVAPAEALAGVYVVLGGRGVRLDGAVRRCLDARRVDVAPQGVVVRGRAQRCDLSQRDVEAELDIS